MRGAGRLLYVEDEGDVRSAMEILLRNEGYEVVPVSSAGAALDALRRGEFEVVLTDFRLGEATAEGFLATAEAEGRLARTGVVVLSGEPCPPGMERYRCLLKPVDIDVLRGALVAAAAEAATEAPAPGAPVAAPAVELRLYVSAGSSESQKAARNLRRILARCAPGSVRLTIQDVRDPAGGAAEALEEDRIVVTPTLVRRHPAPKVWILGDLSRAAGVEDLLPQPAVRGR